ncbi:carbohydate-binding domain-containing protein [Rhodocaloribacter litoris]|nr:carbohydate-binding domain-containing protein [Rhodocaloribacter litoris]
MLVACETPPESAPLRLTWGVVENRGQAFDFTLTLTNAGTAPWPASGWTLYFNSLRRILPESVPPEVTVEHVNGDLFRLFPTDAFPELAPGDSLTLTMQGQYWAIKRSDAPAGFYLIFEDDRDPVPVPVTVRPFTSERQTRRSPADVLPVPTAASVYRTNAALPPHPPETPPVIVPTPVRMTPGTGTFTLTPDTPIRHAEGLDGEAAFLAEALAPLLGTRPPVEPGTERRAGAVVLETGPVAVPGIATHDEAYRLAVTPEGIRIAGEGPAGVFYGVQSLRALLPVQAYAGPQPSLEVPALTLEDAPRFPYRGFHLDVARNFQPKEAVLKLLDLMAFYKLNRFHFHLTDDEGWRLAIPDLPELTDVGGRRGHTTDERDRLVPSYGSGPFPDHLPGSGHYTRDDFVEILRHATARHIEVIPEVDVPGHARAAIRAMEARHARLLAEDRPGEAAAYRLIDPDDASSYRSVQMWDDNVLNPCVPGTYRFLEAVFDALVAMYAEAGAPLTTVHIGGDEVPHGVWERSPACAALIAEDPALDGTDDLWDHFLRRTSDLLAARGLTTAGWEEIALAASSDHTAGVPNPGFARRGFRAYVWNTVWGWGAEDLAYRLANAGYPVVLSNAPHLYFDMAYDKHPEEPGFYWAGFTDTRAAFELVPFDLFKNARADALGRPLDPATFTGRARLTETGRRNILGLQGQLWGETLISPERLEYMAFPKLLGLAERAWAPEPAWARHDDPASRQAALAEAWSAFAHRLGRRELPRLDHLHGGVAYRLPPPGAVIENGLLHANVAFPGLTIRYTTDGTEPTATSTVYAGPVAVTGPVKLRTFDTRGRGSRTVEVHP